jgi:hypothetical protein
MLQAVSSGRFQKMPLSLPLLIDPADLMRYPALLGTDAFPIGVLILEASFVIKIDANEFQIKALPPYAGDGQRGNDSIKLNMSQD